MEETLLFNCVKENKKKSTFVYINYVYKFPDIFSESKSTNTNLERLTYKLNVKHYAQVCTGSRPRISPFSVRRISMSGMTEEYPFALQNNTLKEKQFILCRIKESAVPGWKAPFWKRPKGPNNCNGLERPSPLGQQFTCQPGYL